MADRAIIIGASHAGAQLCASLRQEGWTGEILLIGNEKMLPYHRPPLSKTLLSGQANLSDLLIREPDFYTKQRITIRHGLVTAIDRAAHKIMLRDGEELGYEKLALCMGARPRQLSIAGAELAGVHYLRDSADIEKIRKNLSEVRRAVVIGGGYIGLEAAASLRSLGIAVAVLETADRVLQRVTAPQVSAFYTRIHREEGVDVRTNAVITAIEGVAGKVSGVRLSGDEYISAELVIIGIGVVANTELAEAAGITVDNGILIDAHGITNDPDIAAAGDCANHFCNYYVRRVRLESVPNANEHAKVAAATFCGKSKVISSLPWFWSDQYDFKLQIAGISTGYDEIALNGDPDSSRHFSCHYYKNGKMIAADCINEPQEFIRCKRLISESLQHSNSIPGKSANI